MYFDITAQPLHDDGSTGFEDRNPLHEHGVSLVETMANMGNTMLDHLHIGAWDITVTVDDPQPANQAPKLEETGSDVDPYVTVKVQLTRRNAKAVYEYGRGLVPQTFTPLGIGWMNLMDAIRKAIGGKEA